MYNNAYSNVNNNSGGGHSIWSGIFIGLGIGLVGGGVGGYFIAKRRTVKKERAKASRAIKSAKDYGYETGYNTGFTDGVNTEHAVAEKFIEEHFISIEGNTPEARMESVEAGLRAMMDRNTSEAGSANRGLPGPNKGIPEGADLDDNKEYLNEEVKKDVSAVENGEVLSSGSDAGRTGTSDNAGSVNNSSDQWNPREDSTGLIFVDSDLVYIKGPDGQEFKYPKAIFFDDRGNPRAEVIRRALLKEQEKDIKILGYLWEIFGWGEYHSGGVLGDIHESYGDVTTMPDPDEMNNWNLEIEAPPITDLDEAMGKRIEDDDPEEVTKEREKYLNEMRRYANGDPEMRKPKIISEKEFKEDNYREHIWINYYEQDDVFEEANDLDRELNIVELLGVGTGQELFDQWREFDPEEDHNDKDIIRVKNLKFNCVIEVTRYPESYASIRDGSAFVDGSTDRIGGAEGV